MIFPDEMVKNTNIYQSLILDDIYPENELKKYVNEIKKIVLSNQENNKGVFEMMDERKKWFYTFGKNIYYFLEHLYESNGNLRYNGDGKKQYRLIFGNLNKMEEKCAMK